MKIIKLAAVIGAIALFIPTPARAEWVYVTSNDDTRTFIQTDSINYKGREVFFVQRSLKAFPDEDGAIASVTYMSIDCLTGRRNSYRMLGYNRRGSLLFDDHKGVATAPASPPGSRGADIYDFVCR